MTRFHLGDRRQFGHRERTVGITAERAGVVFGITTIDLSTADGLIAGPQPCHSSNLMMRVALSEILQPPRNARYSIVGLSELDLLLDVTVRRFTSRGQTVFGRVTALRGEGIILIGEQTLTVTQLVEVTFDTKVADIETELPALEGEDSGALVTTWDGRVVGLLVAGRGEIGFVAPLHQFLATEGLEICEVAADPGLGENSHAIDADTWASIKREVAVSDAAISSFGAELAREPSLGLPALEGKAA